MLNAKRHSATISTSVRMGLRTRSVPTVERTFAIVELLALSQAGLTLSQVARRLSAPRSSVHSIILTLERLGYVHRHPETHRYALGLKLLGMATLPITGMEIRQHGRESLRCLMERTHLTAHMAILEKTEAVLVDKLEAPGCRTPT